MPTFQLQYTFDGFGHVYIEATTEEEARDKFFEGEFINDHEDEPTNFEIQSCKPV